MFSISFNMLFNSVLYPSRLRPLLEQNVTGSNRETKFVAERRLARANDLFRKSAFHKQQEVEIDALSFLIDDLQALVGRVGITERSFLDGTGGSSVKGSTTTEQKWGSSDYVQGFRIDDSIRIG
jgi:hypothetical protein